MAKRKRPNPPYPKWVFEARSKYHSWLEGVGGKAKRYAASLYRGNLEVSQTEFSSRRAAEAFMSAKRAEGFGTVLWMLTETPREGLVRVQYPSLLNTHHFSALVTPPKEVAMTTANPTRKNPDQVNQIIAYEQGELSGPETIRLFASLIKTGTVWQLQGHYGRTAKQLIMEGYISTKGKVLKQVPEENPLLMVVPNPTSPQAAIRNITSRVLSGMRYQNGFRVSKTSFSGLGYGDGYFVIIKDWTDLAYTADVKKALLGALKAVALPGRDDKVVVEFKGPGISANTTAKDFCRHTRAVTGHTVPQYRTVNTRTLKGLKEAERLHAQGWKQGSVGLDTIQFYRKSPAGVEAWRRAFSRAYAELVGGGAPAEDLKRVFSAAEKARGQGLAAKQAATTIYRSGIGRTVKNPGRGARNDSEREQWVNNDEGLYNWWKSEGGSVRSFVKAHRAELDAAIDRALAPREKTWRDYARSNPGHAYHKREAKLYAKRMVGDVKAGHREAADYWQGALSAEVKAMAAGKVVSNPRGDDMGSIANTPEFKKAVALYKKFHGCEPKSYKRVLLPTGSKNKVDGRGVFVSLGKAPAESYTPPAHSKKAGSIYVHKYEGTPPEKVVSADGKMVITLPGKHRVSDWIRG